MLEIVEKTLLTALGAASLTQRKAEDLANELKQRFDLSEEEGKELIDKLQAKVSDRQSALEEQATQEVLKACERIGLVSNQEFDKLKDRVATLEQAILAQQ
ncbi:MAG: phasin superfamily protein [Desulfobacteraceae bacterium 4572_35.1]|nr:MAG: phasin superfamily protein [Desulfobacteraceae bacterium 4572_35.1]